jgi:hypothetical protein
MMGFIELGAIIVVAAVIVVVVKALSDWNKGNWNKPSGPTGPAPF